MSERRRMAPATTPEGREQQLIAMAMDAVEKRIENGTATAQELCHFLKMGSPSAKLEREILEEQVKLLQAKTDAIQSSKDMGELYMNALNAMRSYSGNPSSDEYEYED